MTLHLGDVPASSTLYIPFHTFNSSGASVTISGLAVTDIEIYKNGSVTQRSSDAGYALLDTDGIDFDGITGIHGFSVDLSDNTDAGFYAVGSFYWVVVSSITVNTQTVNMVAATFRIVAAEGVAGKPKVDVDAFGGTAGTFSGGRPEVNTTHAAGTAWGSGAITAGSIAADAITAAKVAADVAAEIADAVLDEAQADHVGVGTFGVIASEIADILVHTGTTLQGELDAIQADTEDIQARLPGALTADGNIKADTLRVGGTLQTAGDIIGDTNDIQTKIGTPAGASVSADIAAVKGDTAAILVDTGTTLDGKIDTVDTVVDAIKAKTDSLTFTLAGHVDANVQRINDVAITGDGSAGDKFDVV